MTVEAVSGVTAVAPTGYLAPPQAPTGIGEDFAATLAGAVDGVRGLQSEASTLAIRAVTGDLTDIHNATVASTRAAVALELVAAVRNKGVEAFTEIMRMQA